MNPIRKRRRTPGIGPFPAEKSLPIPARPRIGGPQFAATGVVACPDDRIRLQTRTCLVQSPCARAPPGKRVGAEEIGSEKETGAARPLLVSTTPARMVAPPS